jgi:hypothetical protein
LFPKTRWLISIKIDANYPCIKGIQVCLDKGTDPYQRGDDNKNANIGWPVSKKSCSQEPMIQKRLTLHENFITELGGREGPQYWKLFYVCFNGKVSKIFLLNIY